MSQKFALGSGEPAIAQGRGQEVGDVADPPRAMQPAVLVGRQKYGARRGSRGSRRSARCHGLKVLRSSARSAYSATEVADGVLAGGHPSDVFSATAEGTYRIE